MNIGLSLRFEIDFPVMKFRGGSLESGVIGVTKSSRSQRVSISPQ